MKLVKLFAPLCLAAVLAAVPLSAVAGDYPSKTIQFIVNKGPGGGSDTVTRMYAACLEKVLGAKTVVINRPGGDGVVGTNDVVKAPPDGYTLFISVPWEIAYAVVFGAGAQVAPDSFTYIANLNVRGTILAVSKEAPFKTFAEFVDYARANPRKVTVGTPGGTQAVNVGDLGRAIGAELTVINAGNGNQLFTQVAGGHIDVAFIGAQFYPKFQDEGCPVIAQTVIDRADGWPDLPTVAEFGYDFETDMRMFVSGPAGMPAEVVKILENATEEMFTSGLLPEMLRKAGEVPKFQGTAELNAGLDKFYPEVMAKMKAMKDARK